MSDWVRIPAELVKDKLLPSNMHWHLNEDSSRFASIRSHLDLVYGIEKRGGILHLIRREKDGSNEEVAKATTLEEAVNYIYARVMLGE